MRSRLNSVFLILILPIPSCASQRTALAERERLLQADRAWAAAAGTDDLERILTFWADDAKIYAGSGPPIAGKDAIRSFITRNRSQPGFSITWEPTDAIVSRNGDLVITMGTGRISMIDGAGKKVARRTSYGSVWRKVDGEWKCAVEFPSGPGDLVE